MAALSADATRKTRNRGNVKYEHYKVATSSTVYKGGLVSIVTTTGRLVAASATTSNKFAGLATQTATGNTAGTVYCKVEWNIEALFNALTALTTAYTGANVCAYTDNDVQTASAAGTSAVQVLVGELINFESGDAWVSLRNYAEAAI